MDASALDVLLGAPAESREALRRTFKSLGPDCGQGTESAAPPRPNISLPKGMCQPPFGADLLGSRDLQKQLLNQQLRADQASSVTSIPTIIPARKLSTRSHVDEDGLDSLELPSEVSSGRLFALDLDRPPELMSDNWCPDDVEVADESDVVLAAAIAAGSSPGRASGSESDDEPLAPPNRPKLNAGNRQRDRMSSLALKAGPFLSVAGVAEKVTAEAAAAAVFDDAGMAAACANCDPREVAVIRDVGWGCGSAGGDSSTVSEEAVEPFELDAAFDYDACPRTLRPDIGELVRAFEAARDRG